MNAVFSIKWPNFCCQPEDNLNIINSSSTHAAWDATINTALNEPVKITQQGESVVMVSGSLQSAGLQVELSMATSTEKPLKAARCLNSGNSFQKRVKHFVRF